MVAIFLNCLYAGGVLNPPFFKGHYDMFQMLLKGQELTPVILQENLYEEIKDTARPDFSFTVIPNALETRYTSEYDSVREAWKAYIQKESPIYMDFLSQALERIEQEAQQKIDAVLTYGYSPSLRRCCTVRDIPVIEFEYSPIRFTTCRFTLGYFCRDNKFSVSECEKRYQMFQEEAAQSSLDYFSRLELIALTLLPQNIAALYSYGQPAEYEIGIPLAPPDDCLHETWGRCSNDALVGMAVSIFGNSVLLRSHPEGVEDARRYGLDIDSSASSQEFVTHCKRIATNISNVGFDAMLFGKFPYILGELPFAFQASRNLERIDDFLCGNEFLNYMIFGFFVPFDLMHDVEYISWRLSNPSEMEIYNRNREHILIKMLQIDPSIISENPSRRLNRLLAYRGAQPYKYRKGGITVAKGSSSEEEIARIKAELRTQERKLQEKMRSMRDPDWVKKQLAERDKEIFELEKKLAQFEVMENKSL